MNWNEMIQMRREKEQAAINPLGLSLPVERYDYVVTRVLKTLSDLENMVIRLRFICGLPIARVADRLGVSWSYADQLIDLAVAKIYARLPAYVSYAAHNSNVFNQGESYAEVF